MKGGHSGAPSCKEHSVTLEHFASLDCKGTTWWDSIDKREDKLFLVIVMNIGFLWVISSFPLISALIGHESDRQNHGSGQADLFEAE